MSKIIIFLIVAYKSSFSRIFTYLLGNACRFTPTCSEYTIEALEKYGTLKGLWMGIKRLSRCHPLGGFGWDPVK